MKQFFSHHFRKMDKPSNDSIPVQQKNIRIFTPSSDYMNASVFNLSVLKTRDHASNFRSAMKHFKVKLVIRIRHFMIFFYRVLWADYFFNCRWHTIISVILFLTNSSSILLLNVSCVPNMCMKHAYAENLVWIFLMKMNLLYAGKSVLEFFNEFLHWTIHWRVGKIAGSVVSYSKIIWFTNMQNIFRSA